MVNGENVAVGQLLLWWGLYFEAVWKARGNNKEERKAVYGTTMSRND